jgi:hypothetical protein
MKKQQVDHVLRAAGRITGEKRYTSRNTEWLNSIGMDSEFHETFGYLLTRWANPLTCWLRVGGAGL